VQDLVPSSLLSKNIKLKIYRTVILLVILYGCETWSLTLRKEHRLKVFEILVLRKVFGTEWDKVTGELYNEEIYYLYSSLNIIRVIKPRRMRWAANVVWEKEELHTGFWWGNLWERDHSQVPDIHGRIILRWISRKWEGKHGLDCYGSG
jgi:hypothetical protein